MIVSILEIIINIILIMEFSRNETKYAKKPLIYSCMILVLWSFSNLIILNSDDLEFIQGILYVKYWAHLAILYVFSIALFELYNRKKVSEKIHWLFIIISIFLVIIATFPKINPLAYTLGYINISNNIFLNSPLSILNYITISYILLIVFFSLHYLYLINRKLNNITALNFTFYILTIITIVFLDRIIIIYFGERIIDIVPVIISGFYILIYSSLESTTHSKSIMDIIELISNSVDNISFGYTRNGNIVYANPQAIKILGIPENYMTDGNIYNDSFFRENISKDILLIGQKYYKKYSYNIFSSKKFMATGINFVNITNEAKLNEKLEYTSKTDWLIGSKNRNAFFSVMERINLDDYDDFAILVLDLDNLKITNDLFGHLAGNELLKKIPVLIEESFQENTYDLYRVGGDEFIIITKNLSKNSVLNNINSLYIKTSLYNKNNTLQIFFSIGCAMKSNLSKSFEDLYIFADVAMYYSKNNGKNRLTFFTEEMFNKFIKSNKIKDNFAQAFFNNKIQPKIQLAYNVELAGLNCVEVYPQWIEDEILEIEYNEILDVAKNVGLIIDLDLYILKKSCQLINEMNIMLNKKINLCVNLSIDSFLSSNIYQDIIDILNNNFIDPKNLILQVDDRPLTNKVNTAKENLIKLKEIGIKIALRDFGKGFSNIDSINRLGNEFISIHPCLLDSSSLPTIIKILKNQGCKIILNNINNEKDFNFALDNKVDYILGDYVSPYVDIESFKERVVYELI